MKEYKLIDKAGYIDNNTECRIDILSDGKILDTIPAITLREFIFTKPLFEKFSADKLDIKVTALNSDRSENKQIVPSVVTAVNGGIEHVVDEGYSVSVLENSAYTVSTAEKSQFVYDVTVSGGKASIETNFVMKIDGEVVQPIVELDNPVDKNVPVLLGGIVADIPIGDYNIVISVPDGKTGHVELSLSMVDDKGNMIYNGKSEYNIYDEAGVFCRKNSELTKASLLPEGSYASAEYVYDIEYFKEFVSFISYKISVGKNRLRGVKCELRAEDGTVIPVGDCERMTVPIGKYKLHFVTPQTLGGKFWLTFEIEDDAKPRDPIIIENSQLDPYDGVLIKDGKVVHEDKTV